LESNIKKIIAITGGSGFIGKKLVEAHAKSGDEVRVFTRKSYTNSNGVIYFQGNLLDKFFDFSEFLNNVDILYHCAGELNDSNIMHSIHVDGTRRLLEASVGKIGRWVQLSSVGAYGECLGDTINEISPENPFNHYEVTKTKSDELIQSISAKNGIDYVILRPSIVFGEMMTNNSLKQLLEFIDKGLFFYIKKNSIINYVHVDDVVEALILCGESNNALNQIFILSDSVPLNTMVKSFSLALGVKQPSIYVPKGVVMFIVKIFGKIPKFPLTQNRLNALSNNCIYDSNKIKKTLGFSFKKNLEVRFREYAEYNSK
jgi:nucleoside-diphosphate-sugar epimerase